MELFDTAFIVLRKQKLIFLHWYHHITVMWMSFFSYIDVSSSCRLFMVMNFSVHSMMYTYYTLRAMRIQVPKMFAVMTTSLQIIQMVFGLLITLTVIQYKQNGLGCSVSDEQNKISFFIYTSYFILFARYLFTFRNGFIRVNDCNNYLGSSTMHIWPLKLQWLIKNLKRKKIEMVLLFYCDIYFIGNSFTKIEVCLVWN